MSHPWFADRFIDDTVSNDAQLSPIYGYQCQPLVSLEKALEPIRPLIDSLVEYIKVAEERCHYPNEHGLTKDQSASVYLYTMEWGNDSFYRVFNAALRTKDRSTLKPWFAFLKLFDTALKKLPHLKQNVWRGVRSALGKECKKGDELIWWSINSCSLDVHVIELFLAADSTLFQIEALNARDITGYTNYPDEHEVILPPGICLNVVANSMEHTGGLHVVHLREVKFSGHSKCLLSIPLGKNSAKEHQVTQAHASQSKIVAWIQRAYLKKPCIAATVIVILVGIVFGVTLGVMSRKINFLRKIQPQGNPTTVHPTTALPNSSDTTSDSTQTSTDNFTCVPPYPLPRFVSCRQWTQVLSCGSTNCDQISTIFGCYAYLSDCYLIGKVFTDGDSGNRWYHLSLPTAGYGYVSGVYCFGGLDRCP